MKFLNKLFGTKNDRYLKKIQPVIDAINNRETAIKALSDEQLRGKTAEFRQKLDQGASLDDILIEAFAVVRETGRRVLNMRHYDVQLIGGYVLNSGQIAEMKTGEGKTLVATLPVYLNALSGKGSHLITVNDYLARRDAEWMGQIYRFLGMSVGSIYHGLNDTERRQSYGSDITYGTNNEFGFDYLRDNMKFSLDDYVQRELNFAIVDEVDSILIDEARTPLIISGVAEQSSELYYRVDTLMPFMQRDRDFVVDEKSRSVDLTEDGIAFVEKRLKIDNLYSPQNINLLHHVMQALKAHHVFKLGVDYVVENNKIVIIDEFTGRKMEGRRWSDGLHQAIEAKEGVVIENESQTLATITFQNYFRLYSKLSGMTGTADTEAQEFHDIYKLGVVVVPTNKVIERKDHDDLIYKSETEKFGAIADQIKAIHEEGAPILVGTTSVEKSEVISKFLNHSKIKHNVLNAKNHEREALIVAQAGRIGAVTVATNMAGRGTDIVLGGNAEFMAKQKFSPSESPEDYENVFNEYNDVFSKEKAKVLELGGLHIIGTERHDSRRIDNQLRGRSGRQGDPGYSRFFLSLEDDLLRLFGSDRIKGLMERMGMEEGEPITHPMVTKSVANAQTRVEGRNFESRKNVLEYDDVMDQQRKTVYTVRREILEPVTDMKEKMLDLADGLVATMINSFAAPNTPIDLWDIEAIEKNFTNYFGIELIVDRENLSTSDDLADLTFNVAEKQILAKYEELTEDYFSQISRYVYLESIDSLWKDHLKNMDHLKQGIGLRGYGQKHPIREYKREGFELFQGLMDSVSGSVIEKLMRVKLQIEQQEEELLEEDSRELGLIDTMRDKQVQTVELSGDDTSTAAFDESSEAQSEAPKQEPMVNKFAKIGRNDKCPCGSGKKFKKCCLPLLQAGKPSPLDNMDISSFN